MSERIDELLNETTALSNRIQCVLDAVDGKFGAGFARKNPAIVAELVKSSALLKIADRLKYLQGLESALRALGTSDAATTMGALEVVAVSLGGKNLNSSVSGSLQEVAAAINTLAEAVEEHV